MTLSVSFAYPLYLDSTFFICYFLKSMSKSKTAPHSVFEREVNRVKARGEQYAHWNQELFMKIVQAAAQQCWNRIHKQPNAEQVFAAYMDLIGEGIRNTYLTQSLNSHHYNYLIQNPTASWLPITWKNFLEYCLIKKIPLTLSEVPKQQQLEILVKIWNIGENILQQAPWMGLYILSHADELTSLTNIDAFLIDIMDPLLRPPKPAQWQPPFDVSILDGRDIHDDFLPGEMHEVAPSVVCVHDRRLSGIYGGIFMNNEPNTLLFHHQCLGDSQNNREEISVVFESSSVTIQSHPVNLTRLGEHHSYLVCNGGQLLVSAIDSQRIWHVGGR